MFAVSVLYLMSPLAGDPGLCAVLPDGILIASVAETWNVVAGDAVPTPTLLLVTSNTNKFVSNAKSVPDLARLADNICPVILPIAIVFIPLSIIDCLAKL
jgi:hypothetical protein